MNIHLKSSKLNSGVIADCDCDGCDCCSSVCKDCVICQLLPVPYRKLLSNIKFGRMSTTMPIKFFFFLLSTEQEKRVRVH